MFKPKFQPPTVQALRWGDPARWPKESFAQYKERRAENNAAVKAINAKTKHQKGLPDPRTNRVGKGKNNYGANIMAMFDRQRFPVWKAKQERKLLRRIAHGEVA
jgi:hypothetical protein